MNKKRKESVEFIIFFVSIGVLTALVGFSKYNAFDWNWGYFSLLVIASSLTYRYLFIKSGFNYKNIIFALILAASIIFHALHLLGYYELPLISTSPIVFGT